MEEEKSEIGKTNFIFAYGTLMSGLGNHHFLQAETFVGRATTIQKYSLFAAGVPFVNPTDQRTLILGEVWEVSQEALVKIDKLEGNPDWYTRTPVQVKYEDDGLGPTDVEIYFNSTVSD